MFILCVSISFFLVRWTQPSSSFWLQLLWLAQSSSIQTVSYCSTYGKPPTQYYSVHTHRHTPHPLDFNICNALSDLMVTVKKNVYYAHCFISIRHMEAVCCSRLLGLSALTHFSLQIWVSQSRDVTLSRYVTVTYIFVQIQRTVVLMHKNNRHLSFSCFIVIFYFLLFFPFHSIHCIGQKCIFLTLPLGGARLTQRNHREIAFTSQLGRTAAWISLSHALYFTGMLQQWLQQHRAIVTGTTDARLSECWTPDRHDNHARSQLELMAASSCYRDADEPQQKSDRQTYDHQELWSQVAVTTIYGSPWRWHTETNRGRRWFTATLQKHQTCSTGCGVETHAHRSEPQTQTNANTDHSATHTLAGIYTQTYMSSICQVIRWELLFFSRGFFTIISFVNRSFLIKKKKKNKPNKTVVLVCVCEHVPVSPGGKRHRFNLMRHTSDSLSIWNKHQGLKKKKEKKEWL